MKWLWPYALKEANSVVFNSNVVCQQAVKSGMVSVKKAIVIPNGIPSLNDYQPQNKTCIRKRLGLPITSVLVGCVGRFSEEKGHASLLHAVAMMEDNIHIVLVGQGELESELRELATDLKLKERVHIVGLQNNIPDWLAALDVFVIPSHVEGMSNALLEAMAYGCVIVASDIDGNKELIEKGVNGWLYQSKDSKSLAKVLKIALSNPVEGLRRGQAARKRIQDNYSIEAVIQAWDSILSENSAVNISNK